MIAIELTVVPHRDDSSLYMACWSDDDIVVHHIPEVWLDLMPFMAARRLQIL